VTTKALGQEVLQSLTPEQHFIKVVKDELTSLLGETQRLSLKEARHAIMLVGLQGSGKTTTAEMALYLKRKRAPYLVPAVSSVPQLLTTQDLREQLAIPVHDSKQTSRSSLPASPGTGT
jgi:signal recognition particle subunit SRP54